MLPLTHPKIILFPEQLKDQYKYQIFLVMKKIISTTKRLTAFRSNTFSELSKFKNNFLSTTNVEFIESMYAKWLQDKNSVSPSFNTYFELMEKGEDPENAFTAPPKDGQKIEVQAGSPQIIKQLGVRMMIDRYRAVGHQFAKTDPLEMNWRERYPGALDISSLNIEEFGFSKHNLQDEIVLKYLRQQNSDKKNGPYTIQAMQDYLRNTYMDKIGYEYMHLGSKEERDFLKSFIETGIESLKVLQPSKEERIDTFKRLCRDQCFIDFLIAKFANFKRFGVEGLNAFTSALGKMVEVAAENKVEHIVMGMAHRGRLNALHCVFEKPAQTIFKEFLQKIEPDTNVTSGDVKYHLGYLSKKAQNGNEIYLNMLPNPSHLEAVDPLVYGSTRAIQESIKDKNREKVIGVLIHGDAALAGQGIVYESLQLQDLVDYTTGGIIHIVMNNQVGFTTNPWQSRSSFHCTEIAKVIGAPIIHVNADEPDLLDHCMQIAVQYRQKFKKDIFIDIVGYRRFGHNEQDQPFFTQPKMYEKIKNHPSVFEKYSEKCIQTGAMTKEQIQTIRKEFMKEYEEDYKKVMNDKTDEKPEAKDPYYEVKNVENTQHKTGAPKVLLSDIFKKVTTWPQDFTIHPTIKKIFEERIKNFINNDPLDWATMESLAFGTLIQEGYGLRLSGQDVERGTFSHRHALISDQKRDVQKFNFYKSINPEKVTITNSHLSEYGVSGFEYGYSVTNPNALCIWEAQFGDFANGACTIIDNYLVSGESKWGIQSGLVLSLPHGMDGQGPEHSSARLERFLQMSDDNSDVDRSLTHEQQLEKCNLQIVTCSTTSNYFHVLRRQLRRSFRKPLINFNSKKLLKFKGANRPIEDILEGKEFQPVIGDETAIPNKVQRVLVCNGQFFYELKAKRDELNREDIAIVRIEQIAPFPHEHLKKALEKYSGNVTVDWVQEEHENYGAWTYIQPRLTKLFNKKIRFFGRKPSAATAAGALKLHKIEEAELMKSIFQAN